MNRTPMRTFGTILSGLVLACPATLSSFAQSAPTADPAALARYDRNGNGVLDPEELAAQRADAAREARAVGRTESDDRGEVVQLSPFQVTADEDQGYAATNTMSGTRLNSRLEDLAASITVVTKQQLLDTAAADINDIFLYESGTEGTHQWTNLTTTTLGGITYFEDNNSIAPERSNRIRGVGNANIARNSFSTTGSVPVDTYNIDAVEISRGPNSSIFGLGEAAGTVNLITSRANLTRDVNRVEVRGDSYGGYRGNFDFNRMLKKNVLALRVLGLYEEKGYERKPSRDKTNRYQFALTARPFQKTTLRASYESYSNYNSRPNAVTPRDYVSPWLRNGRPTFDPATRNVFLNGQPVATGPMAYNNRFSSAAGVTSFFSVPGIGTLSDAWGTRSHLFIDDGAIQRWMVGRRSGDITTGTPGPTANLGNALPFWVTSYAYVPGTTPLNMIPGVTDKQLYNWEKVNFASPNWATRKAEVLQVELEQWIIDTARHKLAFQGAYFHDDVDSYSRAFVGSADGSPAAVVIDVNQNMLDGTPNPFFLRPMIIGSEPQVFRRPEENENIRGTIAYELNLTQEKGWLRWVGRHRFSGYGEAREQVRSPSGLRSRDAVTSEHTWHPLRDASGNILGRYPGNTAGRFNTRYYVGDNQGFNIDYGAPRLRQPNGSYALEWYNGLQRTWVKEPATISEIFFSGGLEKQKIETMGAVWQGFLWKDRIIPTLGVREDRSRTFFGGPVTTNPETGFPVLDRMDAFATSAAWRTKGKTETRGIVVKPLSWLNLHYNESDSFVPATLAYDIFAQVLPNPLGEGHDYGFSMTLLKNKLYLRVNRYKTVEFSSRRGAFSGANATRSLRIDFDTATNDTPGGGGDAFDLEDNAYRWVSLEHPEWDPQTTAGQELIIAEVWRKYMGPGIDRSLATQIRSGGSYTDVNTVTSTGTEIELTYNPSRHWRMKFNVTRQKAVDTELSGNTMKYASLRRAHWESLIIPNLVDPTTGTLIPGAGQNWWTFAQGSNQAPRTFYVGSVENPWLIASANAGKPRLQTREWRANFTNNFDLAAVAGDSWLKRLSVGGSLRWEDEAILAFKYAAPDSDGVYRRLDPNQPIKDKARTYADVWLSYNLKLFKNRVATRIQLNVRNVTESGRLYAFGYNPDGSPRDFRIIDPRQFILTASFEM